MMNRLEKIFVVGGIVVGLSLVGFGCYLDSQLMRFGGVLSGSCSVGLVMREILEQEDKRYLEEKKKQYSN